MKRLAQTLAIVIGMLRGVTAEVVVLNDDGTWNWLQDERAVVVGDQVMVASVAMGRADPARAGAIEVTRYDRRTGGIVRGQLHHESAAERRQRWRDDHSCPALMVRPDGRLLAMYSTHGQESRFYFRISRLPADVTAWGEEQEFAVTPGSRVAFPNLIQLSAENDGDGRMFALFRGLDNRLMPAIAHSDDAGQTWSAAHRFMQLAGKATPYVKYAGDGRSTIHIAFTNGHRIDFNNGVYHASYRDGQLWRTNGERIGSTAEGIARLSQTTEIFRANADSVAMISDLALDSAGRPSVVYSVQVDTRPRRPRPVGADHRYRYARWKGNAWQDREIAFAGTETHDAPDDDCTGLAAIDPQDVNIVYISTNADPTTGAPLISRGDGKRHWEIFRGTTGDGGANWNWQPITRDSTADNLRPIVPAGVTRGASPVIWLRGAMRLPKDSSLEIVLLDRPPSAPAPRAAALPLLP